jgi:hypothetical protein
LPSARISTFAEAYRLCSQSVNPIAFDRVGGGGEMHSIGDGIVEMILFPPQNVGMWRMMLTPGSPGEDVKKWPR